MAKLYAYGCSHTFGHGLKDCAVFVDKGKNSYYDPGLVPSKLVWAQLLADRLGLTCVNRSEPGSSVKQQVFSLMQDPITDCDTVVCLWPVFDRSCIFKDLTGTFEHLLVGMKDNESSSDNRLFYKKFYSREEQVITSGMLINLAYFKLKSIGAKQTHLTADPNDGKELMNLAWNSVTLDYASWWSNLHKYPRAIDGSHLGEKGQLVFTKIVHKRLRNSA